MEEKDHDPYLVYYTFRYVGGFWLALSNKKLTLESAEITKGPT